jgi:hypothetical protein
MQTQNITLSIPKDILVSIKVIAAKQGMSISRFMTRILEEIVSREEGYEAARRRHLITLDNKLNLGTNGALSWTREELHER